MHISLQKKVTFIFLLMILNIILRFQAVNHEIGTDSVIMHIMANSLSEFGYAKWFLHFLSIIGLYPASYTSSVPFVLSGISQTTSIEMELSIFYYCIIIGILSMFTAYLMGGLINNDDIFKLLMAFGFSISPGILGYTTWTMATRNLFIVLTPLFVYLLFKSCTSIKYFILTVFLAILLFTTHHLFYFLIPVVFSLIILIIYSKLIKNIRLMEIPEKITPFIIVIGFIFMFSIPFFTGRFVESSRYFPIHISYIRYVGPLFFIAIGGLVYSFFNSKKSFEEWFLLLALMFLTPFIYEQTYMKWFLPTFIIIFAIIGLVNIIKLSETRKYAIFLITVFLVLNVCFSGYLQFLHTYEENPYFERYISESTYKAGQWMKYNTNGSAISNDIVFGEKIFAVSETTRILTSEDQIDQIYGFTNIDISNYKQYPLTDEEFWFSGYEGPDISEVIWGEINMMQKHPHEFNITYVIENRKGKGNIIWNHQMIPSQVLMFAYEKNHIYDAGNIYIWSID